ncbi:MAG: hypothetical protein V8R50_00410 [Clostridia bacterium]
MDEKFFNLPPAPVGVRNWIIKDVMRKPISYITKRKMKRCAPGVVIASGLTGF